MAEVQGRYVRRRILPREVAGIKREALRDTIEGKYQIRLLFKRLGKQNAALRGVCDVDGWVMQQYAEMLHVPRYALMKTCPVGDGVHRDFEFYPLMQMREEMVHLETTLSGIEMGNAGSEP